MADFTALPVTTIGVGPYHFNRYRVAFAKPANETKESLALEFVNSFPKYFNSAYASVKFHTDRKFLSHPTLEFHGIVKQLGMDVAWPHNDWVAQIWCDPKVGFTAQTLKRNFLVPADIVVAMAADLAQADIIMATGKLLKDPLLTVPSLQPPPTGTIVDPGIFIRNDPAVLLNQMHFLAGRRSWRMGSGREFGLSDDILVLETIAVERFSSKIFLAADYLMHLEKKLPAIWIENLANFVRSLRLNTVSNQRKNGWIDAKTCDISYCIHFSASLEALKSVTEFVDAFPLYPTILPD